MNITWDKFCELIKKGVSLDLGYFLIYIESQDSRDGDNPKIPILHQTLIRKGYLSEEGKITLEGKSIVDFVNSEDKVKLVRKKNSSEPIDKFWEVFPGTDTFEHKGKKFYGSRGLKQDKPTCKLKLDAILNEGEYTIDQIIKAVEYDILIKKEQSFKTGQNKISFLQNSATYLRQRSYENFIKLIDKGEKIVEVNTEYNGVNI